MKNNLTAIYPNQKSTAERVSEWFERNSKKLLDKLFSYSYDEKDMPIDASINRIADFVLNRETHEAIELIQKINADVESRFKENSENYLKQSESLKNYLKTKK